MSNNIQKTMEHPYTIDAKVAEIVMKDTIQKFNLITVRFISIGRNHVRFEVEDEVAGEIFEETIRHATFDMPRKVLESIGAILKFYGVALTGSDETIVTDLAKRCVSSTESQYGVRTKDFDVFDADAVLFVSNRNVYNPINGMIKYK
jgi:hypothetical protein